MTPDLNFSEPIAALPSTSIYLPAFLEPIPGFPTSEEQVGMIGYLQERLRTGFALATNRHNVWSSFYLQGIEVYELLAVAGGSVSALYKKGHVLIEESALGADFSLLAMEKIIMTNRLRDPAEIREAARLETQQMLERTLKMHFTSEAEFWDLVRAQGYSIGPGETVTSPY